MNRSRLLLFLLLALCTAGSAGLAAGTTPQDSAQIRQRIDALLKRRQKPEPLPVDPPNPFASAASGITVPPRDPAVPGPAPVAPATVTDKADEDGAASTAELLARLASRLRITGVIRVKNQLNIIINDNPWKEGDYLVLNQGARILRLQVLRIQPGQLTLRLEDAELVLKF